MKFISYASAPLLLLSSVTATINIAAPVNAVSGGPYTVTWTHDASDPSEFTLMIRLVSHSWATGQFWEFTQTEENELNVVFENTYPYQIIPDGIFRLQARNQSDVDQVYSESETFQFLPPKSTPPSTTRASSSVGSSSAAASASITSTTSSALGASRSTSPSSSASTGPSSIRSSVSSTNTNASESSQGASATPGVVGDVDSEDGGVAALFSNTVGASIAALIAAGLLVV